MSSGVRNHRLCSSSSRYKVLSSVTIPTLTKLATRLKLALRLGSTMHAYTMRTCVLYTQLLTALTTLSNYISHLTSYSSTRISSSDFLSLAPLLPGAAPQPAIDTRDASIATRRV